MGLEVYATRNGMRLAIDFGSQSGRLVDPVLRDEFEVAHYRVVVKCGTCAAELNRGGLDLSEAMEALFAGLGNRFVVLTPDDVQKLTWTDEAGTFQDFARESAKQFFLTCKRNHLGILIESRCDKPDIS